MSLVRLAPLAFLIAPVAAPAQNAARVDVALSNFKIAPAVIRLKAGQPYVLHLSSSGSHSFEARSFFAAAKVAPADRAKIPGGKIELGGGKSVDVHFTAPGPGTFPTRCTHFLHASFGMTGKIVVS